MQVPYENDMIVLMISWNLTKSSLGKHLKEKYRWPELNLQLSFKYLVNFFETATKIVFKSTLDPDYTFILSCFLTISESRIQQTRNP